MDKFKEAGIAVYSIYSDVTPKEAKSIMMGYFKDKGPTVVVAQSKIRCPFAPYIAVVDLRTMKYVRVDRQGAFITPDTALKECAKLEK